MRSSELFAALEFQVHPPTLFGVASICTVYRDFVVWQMCDRECVPKTSVRHPIVFVHCTRARVPSWYGNPSIKTTIATVVYGLTLCARLKGLRRRTVRPIRQSAPRLVCFEYPTHLHESVPSVLPVPPAKFRKPGPWIGIRAAKALAIPLQSNVFEVVACDAILRKTYVETRPGTFAWHPTDFAAAAAGVAPYRPPFPQNLQIL